MLNKYSFVVYWAFTWVSGWFVVKFGRNMDTKSFTQTLQQRLLQISSTISKTSKRKVCVKRAQNRK